MTVQQSMIQKYGEPSDTYQAKWCTLWQIQQDYPWFPAKEIFLNKDFKGMLFKSFSKVQELGLQSQIKKYNGCLVVRPVRGSNSISMHSWGAAIDLNADEDPMVILQQGETATPEERLGKWTKEFVDAMCSSGIFFGGNFIHRPDPMHFSMFDM